MKKENKDMKKTVIILEKEGFDLADYPKFCDSYISEATWDNNKELTEDELEEVNNNPDDYIFTGISDFEQLMSEYSGL